MAIVHDAARDEELIERAREVIRRNYDGEKKNHTVGAAVRCASGNVYVGVNVIVGVDVTVFVGVYVLV